MIDLIFNKRENQVINFTVMTTSKDDHVFTAYIYFAITFQSI